MLHHWESLMSRLNAARIACILQSNTNTGCSIKYMEMTFGKLRCAF